MQITALFILEVINIGIALVFLALFMYRLKYLGHFSQTDKYLSIYFSQTKDYYPKVRIFFAVVYVILSFALLGYNIAIKEYGSETDRYIFAGGGGETINSLVLLFQLAVLRQELKKERPYTPTHMIYFFYLLIISITRFSLTLTDVVQNQTQQIVDLILATCLMIDACIQLGYWVAKKQTLPQFQSNNYFSFDQFRMQSNRHLINRLDVSSKIQQKSYQDGFPYIKSTVKIQNSKFRIILQIFVSNKILPSNFQQTGIQKPFLNPQTQKKQKNRSSILRDSVRRSYRSNNHFSKTSLHLQIISEHLYNLQQVKQLYILCGRFPLKKQIIFTDLPLRQVAKNLQVFLDQLFDQRQYYQPFLLKYFHIDKQFAQIYEQKNKNLQEIIVSDHQTEFQNMNSSYFDKNAIYLSIQIYKQLWIEDHYEFYMKICVKENSYITYPMRRYSEFQDFHQKLKLILTEKGKNASIVYSLPELPKKHLFYWDQEKIKHRRLQLQIYLRKLCNDHELMKIVQFRQIVLKFLNLHNKILHINPSFDRDFYEMVKIIKGDISKALINNEYVTFYQFKLFRQGIQIRSIKKRFSDFVTLNEDISRWMNNVQICYKNIVLPEKHLFKSETHRHEKLRNYLQSCINIKEAFQIYCLNVFLNIHGNTELSDDTFYSAISFAKSREALRKQSDGSGFQKMESSKHGTNSKGKGTFQGYQMQLQGSPAFSFTSDGNRMSMLIQKLGLEQQQE